MSSAARPEGYANPFEPTDRRIALVHAHPLRAQAMELFEARITSPTEVSKRLGERLGTVAYHVTRLEEAGLIELVERRRARGAIEHYYTASQGPTISDGEWGTLAVPKRRFVIAGGLHRLSWRLAPASRGGFVRDGAHIEVVSLRVGWEEWRLAAGTLRRTLARLEGLAAAAKSRSFEARLPEQPHAVVVLALCKRKGETVRVGPQGDTLDPIDLVDPRMAAATAHPLRSEAFRLLLDRSLSPSDLARVLRAPVGNTSYHVRRLAEMGLVRLVKRCERGGAIEHYYAANVVPTIVTQEWERHIADSHAANAAELLVAAARDGGFDADGIHLTRTPFHIDGESWDSAVRALQEVRSDLSRLAGPDRQQTSAASDEAYAVTMLFESKGWHDASNPAAAPPPPS